MLLAEWTDGDLDAQIDPRVWAIPLASFVVAGVIAVLVHLWTRRSGR